MVLLDKFLRLSNPGSVLRSLGEYPKLLENAKLTIELLDQIIASSNPGGVLEILGKHPELLENEKLTLELWDKVLVSSQPASVLKILVDQPLLLKNQKLTTAHWNKILSTEEPDEVLKALVEQPSLLQDPVFLDRMLESKNLLHLLEMARWKQYITIPSNGYAVPNSDQPKVYLNQDLFFDDPSIDQWNNLTQRDGPIDDVEWDIVKTRLADIFDNTYKERDNERDRLFRFLEQCMGTADANTPEGKQRIRKRVDAIVSVLERYQEEMKNPQMPDEKRKAIKEKLIGRTLDLMAIGGSACPDDAIVLLRRAENHIKLFENPKYLANIIINMFKLHAIEEKLIDPDNAENVETYLSYTLQLMVLLGLGIFGAMIYEEHYGKTEPFEQALPKLCTAFTQDQLIKYTLNLEEFSPFSKNPRKKLLLRNKTSS